MTIVISCIMLSAAGALIFIYSGFYNVSAMIPHNRVVAWALHKTFTQSVAYHSQGLQPPSDLETPGNVRSGAHFFRDNCAVCHGAPGMQPSNISHGLLPSPPDLLAATRTNEPIEMFWTIKNGVKMTGMPAFGETQSDEQIWALAAFLHKSKGISARDYQTLSGIEPATSGGG